jgi:hypothetical protein
MDWSCFKFFYFWSDSSVSYSSESDSDSSSDSSSFHLQENRRHHINRTLFLDNHLNEVELKKFI